jgi:nucleoside-diphosphate-sugar epimerase
LYQQTKEKMSLKIVVIGASGTIGRKLVESLEEKGHEVIKVSRKSGDFNADIQDKHSLELLFKQIGRFDAVANAVGDVVGDYDE